MANIHPSAIVHDGAHLADDIEIGPFCVVGAGVSLGRGCRLLSHVVIEGRTTIGEDNVFHPFSYIGCAPQDLSYRGEDTETILGTGNIIREGVSIHRGTLKDDGRTCLGDHNLLMGYVHVAHDCKLGNGNILANYVGLSGHVVIQDHVILGGQTGVVQFVRIGSHAYIGGGSLVDRHLPPYTTGYGNRLEVKGVNVVGLKRRGFPRQAIAAISKAHRRIYRSDEPLDAILPQIERDYADIPEVMRMIEFVRNAPGGLVR